MALDPEHLHPLILPAWIALMRRARAAGLNPRLTFTYRSPAEQDRLYARGRDGDPRPRVTNARGGQSWHNVTREGRPASLAFDIALLGNDGRSILPSSDPAWVVLGELGEVCGLTWGGRFGDDPATARVEGWDLGHFQLDDEGGLTLHEAMIGIDPDPVG